MVVESENVRGEAVCETGWRGWIRLLTSAATNLVRSRRGEEADTLGRTHLSNIISGTSLAFGTVTALCFLLLHGLAPVSAAIPAPKLIVGNHSLLPDTADQQIRIVVTGATEIHGMNFNLQVADGGPAVGGTVIGPTITAVDFVSDEDMVFFGNSTESVDPGSAPQLAIRTITTGSGSVVADGLLAVVTVDTTGIVGGTYPLKMGATLNGSSDFAGTAIDITEGTISVDGLGSKIVVGRHQLEPDAAGQQIQIFVTGNDQVHGMNFNLQVADGGPAVGGVVSGPVITAVDLVSDQEMIFFGKSTQPVNPGSFPQIALRAVTTSSGTVVADGLLATITVDTRGVAPGTYALTMGETLNGASDFAGVPIDIVEGSITIGTSSETVPVVLRIRNVSTPSETRIEISFTPQPGRNHRVQFRNSLLPGSSWQDLPGGPHNSGTVIDTPGDLGMRYYQLRQE